MSGCVAAESCARGQRREEGATRPKIAWPDRVLLADVDECRNRSFCGAHAVCQNLPGSFQCLCDQGYEGARDRRHCVGTGSRGHGAGFTARPRAPG